MSHEVRSHHRQRRPAPLSSNNPRIIIKPARMGDRDWIFDCQLKKLGKWISLAGIVMGCENDPRCSWFCKVKSAVLGFVLTSHYYPWSLVMLSQKDEDRTLWHGRTDGRTQIVTPWAPVGAKNIQISFYIRMVLQLWHVTLSHTCHIFIVAHWPEMSDLSKCNTIAHIGH